MENPTYTITVQGGAKHQVILDAAAKFSGTLDGKSFSCDVINDRPNHYHVLRDGVSYLVEIEKNDLETKQVTLKVNGHRYVLEAKDKYDELLHSLGLDALATVKVNELKAPMPGLVLDIRVAVGQTIAKGDPLVVLEAMKMENILKSPADVTIKKIIAQKGNAVEKGQVLILFA